MSQSCTTNSVLPQWVTIGFTSATISLLLIISIYSFYTLNKSKSKLSTKTKSEKLTPTTETKEDNKSNKNEIIEEEKMDKDMISIDNDDGRTHISLQDNWESLGCFGKFSEWFKDVLGKYGIYGSLIAHLADTATDFASVVEFYEIATDSKPEDCGGLNVWWLFGLAVGCMIVYRMVSSYTIFTITNNWKRVMMQFIDIEIFHILYYSYEYGLQGKSSPQRLISVLEAVFEAAPQSVIQMVYLMKTGNLNGIILVSSVLSFINLTMTIIGDDKNFIGAEFVKPWKDGDEKYFRNKSCWKFGKYMILYLFRVADIPSKILEYIFVWYFINGYALTIVFGIDMVIGLVCYFKTNKYNDALLTIIAMPFSFGSEEHRTLLKIFYGYSFVRFLSIHIIIWIVMESFIAETTFVQTLWLYTFCAAFIKFILFGVLWIYDVWKDYSDKSKDRGDLNGLVKSEMYDDALELMCYIGMDMEESKKKVYGGKYGKCSLLAIA
eukprot:279113_1